ncbi:hypothetical protein [Armatimonas sp.]|uniref:DUF2628 domain-containing protein n=1 Tax=Armatimonas sp. TaxID=1872638 RepID=UPI00286ABDB7|nr:hypothetical protein [Armatimonas sp.]
MAEEQALRDQGAQLLREGKASEAATLLRQATEQNPQDEGGWRLLGAALGQSHDLAGSVSAFQKAVALVPTSAKNHYNLAVALQVNARENEARQHLEKALALDPAYEQARLRLRDLAAKTAPAPMGKMTPAAPPPPTMSLTPVGGGGLHPVGGGLAPIGGGAPEPPAPSGLQPVGGGNAPNTPPTGSREKPLDMYEGLRATGFDAYRNMQGDVDSAVRGWNWGAFMFGPIWLINHGMREIGWGWIIGGIFIGGGLSTLNVGWVGGVFNLIQFGVRIFLGICGNRVGWESRSWDDVDDFKKCQRTWAWWALAIFLLTVVLFVTLSALMLSLIGLGALGSMKEEPKTQRMRAPDGTSIQMKTNNDGSSEMKMPDGSTMKVDSQGNMTVVQPGGASQPIGR